MIIFISLLALLMGLSPATPPAVAQHQHGTAPGSTGAGEKKMEPSPGQETSPRRTFLLDGVKASFSILAMAEHKKMLNDMKMKVEVDPQATHHIAVTITDTRSNQPLRDAVVKMKVIGPKGEDQVRMLDSIMGMNEYAADFILSQKGRYQILILFKDGGKKRAAGFYFSLK
ncbi:MAG: FixH family protein [Planctomycetaceae bacterium]